MCEAAKHLLLLNRHVLKSPKPEHPRVLVSDDPATGALIIRIGFGGILYYNYHKEPPKLYSNY